MYGQRTELDGDRSGKPISARDALARSTRNSERRSEGLNYKLTIGRLYKIIENAADKGADHIVFQAPKFVLDGCLGDPIKLAKQLKARLSELGYKVRRKEDVLTISWQNAN